MRDEPPRRPFRETPAPDGPPPPDEPRRYELRAPRLDRDRSNAGAFGQGIMAALLVAATAVMIGGLAMMGVMVASFGRPDGLALATRLGLLVLAGGFLAAVIVSMRLPRAAWPSFWAMGMVCVACALIFLVGVFGMKVPGIGG